MFKIKAFEKQNIVFVFSLALMYLLELSFGKGQIKSSYIVSISFIFLIFNIYLVVNKEIKKWGRILNVLTDLILCVTEKLKAENQMLWVGMMNNIRSSALEIVTNKLIDK